jgi:hypothetical protein
VPPCVFLDRLQRQVYSQEGFDEQRRRRRGHHFSSVGPSDNPLQLACLDDEREAEHRHALEQLLLLEDLDILSDLVFVLVGRIGAILDVLAFGEGLGSSPGDVVENLILGHVSRATVWDSVSGVALVFESGC